MHVNKTVTLHKLQTFVDVVLEGNFSKAATSRGIDRSAVSATVQGLELALDVELFDRSTRIPTITDAGRRLLPEALGILKRIDGLRAVVQG